MAKVTVIIPTYRRPEFLYRAIASVLAQTYKDFDLLVIDDASQDATREVVGRIADERMRYFQNEVNVGGSSLEKSRDQNVPVLLHCLFR